MEKKLFERKIEEDRLGISRKKQRPVMPFMTYRLLKLVLLLITALMLFIYTPAVLPLTIIIALMLITTKKIEKAKKNVNKKYRIKIRATDSVIAIIMIALTLIVTGYSLVSAYLNGGTLTDSAALTERLAEQGFSESQIEVAVSRMTESNSYEQIFNNAMSLLTGNRNSFAGGRMSFRGGRPSGGRHPANFEGMGDGAGFVRMRRPNILQMMRNMPIEMVFQQLFQMICAVVAGIINVIQSFKYGEIKKVTLGKKFAVKTKDPNDLCPCGSGKKIKKCGCVQAKYYTDFH